MPRNPRAPMLAQKYDVAKVAFPCVVQAKLDGVRCVAYVLEGGEVELRSRDDKPLHMGHVALAVARLGLPAGTVLDGELYRHGTPFQELSGNVRRELQDERKLNIPYYVYDVVNDPAGLTHTKPYPVRAEWVQSALPSMDEPDSAVLIVLDYQEASSAEEVAEFERGCVERGFEGAMVRTDSPSKVTKKNPEQTVAPGFYEAQWHGESHGRRSWFLQKVKSFDDSEATIAGVEEEVDLAGVPKGRAGKFVMKEADGTVFRASGLTDAMKEEAWAHPERFIGVTATFKFFGRSTEGVPRHPNFKALRPAGELDAAV